MQALRGAFDGASATNEIPVLLTSGGVTPPMCMRSWNGSRPDASVLAQAEISPRARIRTVGTI